jgi:hypothetical protein
MNARQKERIKERLKNGESVELDNTKSSFSVWHNEKWGHFCLQMNAKVIKATKTLKPILNKLEKEGAEIIPF